MWEEILNKGRIARKSSFELLRIICMLSIVSLHFVSQSGVKQIANCKPWFYIVLQSYGRIACTVFVMISAWFLSEQAFSLKRIVKVELCAVFYGVAFFLGARLFNADCGDVTLLKSLTPTISGPLWFVMIYIELLFLSPFVNVAIDKLERNVSRQLIYIPMISILLFSSIFKNDGRIIKDITFFPIVYAFIMYVKKYHAFEKVKAKTWLLIGLLSWVFIQALIMSDMYIKSPVFSQTLADYGAYYRSRFWTVPNFLCAFCTFMFFKNIDISQSRLINFVAGPTLGIYMIHQNPIFYPRLWNILITHFDDFYIQNAYFAILLTVILLYIFCGAVEYMRGALFDFVFRILKQQRNKVKSL